MYPISRLIKDVYLARQQSPLGPFETHVSRHICWPWDIDIWLELNNGRTFTLYDLGRSMLMVRLGLFAAIKSNHWGVAVAGSTIRYRRRIRAFEAFEMRSRGLGWDDKFLYIEQGMWKANEVCASHAVLRIAFTDAKGIVSPAKVVEAWQNETLSSPVLPKWIKTWCDAESQRPWPPMEEM